MSTHLRLASLLVLAAFGLAACNDDGDDDKRSDNPQEQVGRTFAQAFNADTDATPIDPKAGDAGKQLMTSDPIDF